MIIDKNDPEYIFTCKKCGIAKPNKEFTKRLTGKRVRFYFSKCTPCQNINVVKWARDSVVSKKYKLKKLFNLEYDVYLNMLKTQKYRCAICNVEESKLNRKLHVDHCHITGKIRGLLCGNCNRALGYIKDNVKSLSKAIVYLNKN